MAPKWPACDRAAILAACSDPKAGHGLLVVMALRADYEADGLGSAFVYAFIDASRLTFDQANGMADTFDVFNEFEAIQEIRDKDEEGEGEDDDEDEDEDKKGIRKEGAILDVAGYCRSWGDEVGGELSDRGSVEAILLDVVEPDGRFEGMSLTL
jgi:hypothetical protein